MPERLKSLACIMGLSSVLKIVRTCKQITQSSCHGFGCEDWRKMVLTTGYKLITIVDIVASCWFPFTYILRLVSQYKPEGKETLHLCLLPQESRLSLSLWYIMVGVFRARPTNVCDCFVLQAPWRPLSLAACSSSSSVQLQLMWWAHVFLWFDHIHIVTVWEC